MEWVTWNDSWPDWPDDGRRVEIELDSGARAVGKLSIDDFTSVDGGEIPHFYVHTDDGRIVSFAENERWRFLDAPQDAG